MGDLFPPGVASAAAQRAVAEQVMSPNVRRDYPPPRARSHTPSRRDYGAQGSSPLEPVGMAIRMVGQFIQVSRGDEQTTAARVTYELEESTAAAVREAQYQEEYEHAAQQLSAELNAQAAQQLHYLETEQRAYAQARLSTMESGLAMEYSQTQAAMQMAYLNQVQEVNSHLSQAEARYQGAIHQQNQSHEAQLSQLRRELLQAQTKAEKATEELQKLKRDASRVHAEERDSAKRTLSTQAELWQAHLEHVTQEAESAIQLLESEQNSSLREIDSLSRELIHSKTELEEWETWYSDEGRDQENEADPPIASQAAPLTPPVMQSGVPVEYLPPLSAPSFLPKATSQPLIASSSGPTTEVRQSQVNSPIPTFAPTTPPSLMGQQPAGMTLPNTPVPNPSTPISGGPWASTRERLQRPIGTDQRSCPTSAGVSDTSTIPMHRTGMPAPPPGIHSPSPSVYACPAIHQPSPQSGHGSGGGKVDEVRRDRSPLPKLNIKGGDATSLTRQINEWLQKTTIILNTWSVNAANFWAQAVGIARQQHNWWLSLSPAERATQLGLPTTGQTIPLQLPLLEGTMRAEMLNSVLPDRVTSIAMQKGTTTVLDLLFITFQTFLPSEPSARVDGLATIEAPLRAAKNFQEALSTLRTWRQQVLTVVTDLGGNPEPLKLLSSLKTLISSLVNSDNSFATEVAQMYRTTNVKVLCTDSSLLQMMGLLEIELSSRAQEDDEEKRRRGQGHHVSASSAEADAISKGKGKSKGKQKSKEGGKKPDSQAKGKDKGGDSSKPICTDYLTDNGCPRGDQCTFRHPARVGRCLRCGSTGHQLSTCRRPRRDAKPKPEAKPQAKGQARPKSKARPKNATRRGANAAWAEGEEEPESSVIIEEVDEGTGTHHVEVEYTACSFFTSFLPTYHNASSATSANAAETPELAPILDSGATHCLLPLSWLSDEDADQAKRIHLRVASGSQVRALLFNNIIYARSVTRPLVSIGQLKTMLDLRFVWDDGPPILLFCSSGRKYILLQARVVHHLPLISTAELTVLLSAINSFTTTGALWNEKQWSEQLGTEFLIYNSPTSRAYPPSIHSEDEPEETEAQMMDGTHETLPTTSQPPLDAVEPEVFAMEDQDAPTEHELPILPEAMHLAMTADEARKVLLDHPLPTARQRTNVRTKDYTPQGRLFGAYTTRGEGISQATYRFPLAVAAIMCLAATRGGISSDEGFLSAQVNCAKSLPIHQDKNNHGDTWVTAMGNYEGGRLWVESPVGLYPPPHATEPWHHNLRGDYHDLHNTWVKFSPRCYHAVEEVTSGRRVSLALFSPRSWTRISPHALSELQDAGFYPPRSVQHVFYPPSCEEQAMNGEDAQEEITHKEEPLELKPPSPEEEAILQEWCNQEHVSLPMSFPASSDGEIKPLSSTEQDELKAHVLSGHLTKCHLCRGCLIAEGPRRVHRTVRDVDKATHTLHIDIAGPITRSDDGYNYFLVGALRLPGYPLLIDVRLLQTRTSAEVCHELSRMTAYFESLSSEGFPLTDCPRIRRLHSDRAGEFTAPFFEKFLSGRKGIYHTLTTGYDPQANGTAERTVGLLKAISARCLSSASLDESYWSYAVRYAAQSLLCAALQKPQRSPPFGAQVVAQALGHGLIKYPQQRSVAGRLMFWDHLADQGSFILCPPESEGDEPLVFKAGLPVLSPPDAPASIHQDEHAEGEPEKKGDFPFPLKEGSKEPKDLDPDDDEIELLAFEDDDPDIDDKRRQATTHINVTSDEVLKTTGDVRQRWLSAGQTEIDNLTVSRTTGQKTGALSTIDSQEKERLKAEAKRTGSDYVELPGKVVWTIKPDKYKCRIVACGNQTQDTYGRTSTTDLDTSMLRYILSWAASSSQNAVAYLLILLPHFSMRNCRREGL